MGGDFLNIDAQFVRNRITNLRINKGVSEYQMSYDLGHSRGYIYNISSGKSLPPLTELFSICDYFDITLSDFFNVNIENPALYVKAQKQILELNDNDLQLIIDLMKRLNKK